MSERSAVLGNSVPRPSFDFNGKSYTVGLLTEKLASQLELHLFKRELDRVKVLQEYLAPEDYRDQVLAVSKRSQAGEFQLGNKAYADYIGTPTGALHLYATLIGATSDEVGQMLASSQSMEITLWLKNSLEDSYGHLGTTPVATPAVVDDNVPKA